MQIEDCPKYNTCSVNICPLDAHWRKRRHVAGEKVCPWLMESVKATAADVMAEPMIRWLDEVRPQIVYRWSDIAAALEQAKRFGSQRAKLRGAFAGKTPKPVSIPGLAEEWAAHEKLHSENAPDASAAYAK